MTNDHETILLVEDSMDDVLLIRRALRKAHIANPLQVVSDGEDAIKYLAGKEAYADRERYPLPMVMLLDLKLPRRSGHEVLTWLKAQPTLRRLPVVVLTSSLESQDITRAYDSGANSYLVKPVSFDALHSMIHMIQQYWISLNRTANLGNA